MQFIEFILAILKDSTATELSIHHKIQQYLAENRAITIDSIYTISKPDNWLEQKLTEISNSNPMFAKNIMILWQQLPENMPNFYAMLKQHIANHPAFIIFALINNDFEFIKSQHQDAAQMLTKILQIYFAIRGDFDAGSQTYLQENTALQVMEKQLNWLVSINNNPENLILHSLCLAQNTAISTLIHDNKIIVYIKNILTLKALQLLKQHQIILTNHLLQNYITVIKQMESVMQENTPSETEIYSKMTCEILSYYEITSFLLEQQLSSDDNNILEYIASNFFVRFSSIPTSFMRDVIVFFIKKAQPVPDLITKIAFTIDSKLFDACLATRQGAMPAGIGAYLIEALRLAWDKQCLTWISKINFQLFSKETLPEKITFIYQTTNKLRSLDKATFPESAAFIQQALTKLHDLCKLTARGYTLTSQDTAINITVDREEHSHFIYFAGVLPIEIIEILLELNIPLHPNMLHYYLRQINSFYNFENLYKPAINITVIQDAIVLLTQQKQITAELTKQLTLHAIPDPIDEEYLILVQNIFYAPNLPEVIYTKTFIILQKYLQDKSQEVQQYHLEHLLEAANLTQNLAALTILYSHPLAKITEKFIMSCKTVGYRGLLHLFNTNAKLAEDITISNHLVRQQEFQKYGLKQILFTKFKANITNHAKLPVLDSDAENVFVILTQPNIVIADLEKAMVRLFTTKFLLQCDYNTALWYGFGNLLAIWQQRFPDFYFPISDVDLAYQYINPINEIYKFGSCNNFKPDLFTIIYETIIKDFFKPSIHDSFNIFQYAINLAILLPDKAAFDYYLTVLEIDPTIRSTKNADDIIAILIRAADFSLPQYGYWNTNNWFNFVKNKKFSKKSMELLRSASDLEMNMRFGDTIYSKFVTNNLLRNQSPDFLKTLIAQQGSYANVVRLLQAQCPLAYNKFINKKNQGKQPLSLAQVQQQFAVNNRAILIEFIDQIRSIYEIQTKDISIATLIAFRLYHYQELAELQHINLSMLLNDAILTCLEAGYADADIIKLITIANSPKKFSFVPSVTILGSEVFANNPKFKDYILAPLDPADAMALVAGLKTNCCQHLLASGRQAAMHSFQSHYATVYRLAKQDNPNFGEWLAQAWTAYLKNGTDLVFDSIEFNTSFDKIKPEEVIEFFKYLAIKILLANPKINRILVGASHYARLKLPQDKYKLLAEQRADIADYSSAGYSDSTRVVVLADQSLIASQTLVTDDAELKQSAADSALYELKYGLNTFAPNKGDAVRQAVLRPEYRSILARQYPVVTTMLERDTNNPVVEESFFASQNRHRIGEYFLTLDFAKLWLAKVWQPKLNALQPAHCVIISAEPTAIVEDLKQQIKQNTPYYSLIVFSKIHTVAIFMAPSHKLAFIINAAADCDLDPIKKAMHKIYPDIQIFTQPQDLVLQQDFHSYFVFAYKSVNFFAKNAEGFARFLATINPARALTIQEMPAQLLKMAQTDLNLSTEQQNTIVSRKTGLSLVQYYQRQHQNLAGIPTNVAALKTKMNMIKKLAPVL